MSFDIRAIKVNVHCDEFNQIVDIILARYYRSNNIQMQTLHRKLCQLNMEETPNNWIVREVCEHDFLIEINRFIKPSISPRASISPRLTVSTKINYSFLSSV